MIEDSPGRAAAPEQAACAGWCVAQAFARGREDLVAFDTSRLADFSERLLLDTPAIQVRTLHRSHPSARVVWMWSLRRWWWRAGDVCARAQLTPLVRERGHLVITDTRLYFQPTHNVSGARARAAEAQVAKVGTRELEWRVTLCACCARLQATRRCAATRWPAWRRWRGGAAASARWAWSSFSCARPTPRGPCSGPWRAVAAPRQQVGEAQAHKQSPWRGCTTKHVQRGRCPLPVQALAAATSPTWSLRGAARCGTAPAPSSPSGD